MRSCPNPWSTLALATMLIAGCASFDAHRTPQSETGTMTRASALDFADRLTQAVEGRSLPPRALADYLAARQALYGTAGDPGSPVDRARLYRSARALLATLDTDGHTILWSEAQTAAWYAATPADMADSPAVATVRAVDGHPVMVVQPPQTTFVEMEPSSRYAALLKRRASRIAEEDRPCGVVVDLTESKGGNAWPALGFVGALVGPRNDARYVDRAGNRTIVFDDQQYLRYVRSLGDQPGNPLERFAGTPFAIVVDGDTASAGEMIAVILSGESDVRVFGRRTYGATTSNVIVPLPDHATLLLTIARYAHGDGLPIRGPLQPDELVDDGDRDEPVRRAATWVSQHAPACRAGSAR